MARDHLDAAARRAFFSLNENEAKALIERMVSTNGGVMSDSNPVSKVCILLKKLTCL